MASLFVLPDVTTADVDGIAAGLASHFLACGGVSAVQMHDVLVGQPGCAYVADVLQRRISSQALSQTERWFAAPKRSDVNGSNHGADYSAGVCS